LSGAPTDIKGTDGQQLSDMGHGAPPRRRPFRLPGADVDIKGNDGDTALIWGQLEGSYRGGAI
jgi:hypothetical protein